MTSLHIVLLFLFFGMSLNSMLLLLVSMRSSQISHQEEASYELSLAKSDFREQKTMTSSQIII